MHKENLFKLLKNQVKQLVNVLLSSTKITPSYKKSLIFSPDVATIMALPHPLLIKRRVN
jgi:hypothetical protein